MVKKKMEHKNKIISIFLVTASCIVITYYFVIVLEKGTVYTHLFYIPIILASLWWGRKGFYVSVFLSILLLLNHLFLRTHVLWINDIGRALMFCIVGFFVGTLSERRNIAEEALAASKAYIESIIQNFLDTLIVVDPEAKIKTVNPATCHLLGYEEEELIGKPVSIIFAEEEEEEVQRLFQFFREPKRVEAFRPQDTIRNRELHYKTKDGRLIPMSFNASVLTDEAGNITGVVAGAKDITEIKQAEEARRKTEEHFRKVIENIFKFVPEGLLVFTDKLNLFKQNKAFQEIVKKYAAKLNYTEQELSEIIIEQVKNKIINKDYTEIRIPKKRGNENGGKNNF